MGYEAEWIGYRDEIRTHSCRFAGQSFWTLHYSKLYLLLPPTRQDLTQGQWPEVRLKVGIERWGRSGTSRGSNPAGLCCSSTHLVQCGPDEPSWSWAQIWVQSHISAYSLNWTARFSAIQGGQRCQCCSSPTRR